MFLHGQHDTLASLEAVKIFFEKITNVPNKKIKIFDDMRHEIGFEKRETSDKVLKEVFNWVVSNEISSSSSTSSSSSESSKPKAM